MKNSMKNLIVISTMLMGLFGIVRAEETTVTTTTVETITTESDSGVTVSGEISTDLTFGDENTSSAPYLGVTLSGDGWVISTNLLDGMVNVEEAKYSWSINDNVSLTFGSQAEPYGLAWGLHRPSNNWFVSTPRGHSIMDGVGVNANVGGVGVDFLYGGGTEDYWASRVSFNVAGLGINSEIGLSVNSNEAQLLDVSVGGSIFEASFEYDLSEEADGAYWSRGIVNPFGGVHFLVGYNSNEEVLYGVGYKCNENFHFSTEFSSEDEDDKDIVIRASYSF
jgi:hypothetical protein